MSRRLTLSDFHLFGPLNKTPWREKFANDDKIESEGKTSLRQQTKDLYAASFGALIRSWDKCINVGRNYEEIRDNVNMIPLKTEYMHKSSKNFISEEKIR